VIIAREFDVTSTGHVLTEEPAMPDGYPAIAGAVQH
jgi:hypothetical protein